MEKIKITDARQNNLKGFDLEIPLNKLIVVTGVSGAGKSSLAFDVLYAEGQRRYIETFSPYARQFMERMDRPKVARIEGIPPALAIAQGDTVRTSRSTVGTITEINDYMKLLFARMSVLHCERCGRPVKRDTPQSVFKELLELEESTAVVMTFPVRPGGQLDEIRGDLQSGGFFRAWKDGGIVPIESMSGDECEIVVDRFQFKRAQRKRIIDSIEAAFRKSGRADLHLLSGETLCFSAGLECPYCGISYKAPSANFFSFNSPAGACDSCRGFGRMIDIDLDLIIPDKGKTIREGAVKPWTGIARMEYGDLMSFCRRKRIAVDVPFQELEESAKDLIINGDERFYGIRGFFRWLETKRYKLHVRVFLSRYRGYVTCPACSGTRFKKEVLLWRIQGNNIADLYRMTIAEEADFFRCLAGESADEATSVLIEEINRRLKYLMDVGLDYLTLERQSRTLSGGEVERVSLTKALGSSLVDTLYILDEPTIGLHPRDSGRLLRTLQHLRDMGNTVLVVEHDPEIIRGADHVIDMGPGAGEHGGEVIFSGSLSDLESTAGSLTGGYLKGDFSIPVPDKRRVATQWVTVRGAREHNLKNIDVSFPLGSLVAVTGVSGSGKSTLGVDVLFNALKQGKGEPGEKPGLFSHLEGVDLVGEVILVDQRPVGKTPRATPVTYMKAYDQIRNILAAQPLAAQRGRTASAFSFNTAGGGRCEVCRGEGFEKIEMQFLSDVFVQCTACSGKRFTEELLEIKYRGKHISDILSMTVSEAVDFFADYPKTTVPLGILASVGLGYLRLGQPVNTLSGGEAQRLKLAQHIGIRKAKKALFIFDEPSIGLHPHDVSLLLETFEQLIGEGHSIVFIEHNPEMIKCADHVIDLGPEGGGAGGAVVAAGTPEEIARVSQSHTGHALRPYLQGRDRSADSTRTRGSAADAGQGPARRAITVRGAREHNLADISISIPRETMVVITGVSGSGKSTLAFDILFAEGQRRYLECLPTYIRQYLKIMERPDIDDISGIPPTVAIEQRASRSGRRSTVATLTETYHYLRLLYSKLGVRHCPECKEPIRSYPPETIADEILDRYRRKKICILAPVVSGRKGVHRERLTGFRKLGFSSAWIDGNLRPLEPVPDLDRFREHDIDIVIGDVLLNAKGSGTLEELVQKGIQIGKGTIRVMEMNDRGEGARDTFSDQSYCFRCGRGFEPLDPRLFSFNSRQGACPSCEGLGVTGEIEEIPCPLCNGKRLRAEALAVKVQGWGIGELVDLPIRDSERVIASFAFTPREEAVADGIMRELLPRLRFLKQVGLDYLTLNRSGDTLSGGEAQRIRLAGQLGSNMRGVCYILDEPTIGLHPRDNRLLISTLRDLQQRGNSILVVEHDEETIRAGDYIIDLGPGAGPLGGRIVAEGTLQDIQACPESVTGACLAGARPQITSRLRVPDKGWLEITGADKHNLKGVGARIPLGTLTCVTGVSGSGKSTLVKEVIYPALKDLLSHCAKGGSDQRIVGNIAGWERLRKVVEIDHSPIGRTPRSTPATYIGLWDEIRRLFALVPEARARGFGAGPFSFNVSGGRCESCAGQGRIRVEMDFLPDVYVTCEECGGHRFNEETLDITFRGRSIHDVLEMTFGEGLPFFSAIPKLREGVELMVDIGLDYLTFGQPSPTLSGGEAQRIKLARQLTNSAMENAFYILDEPTTGLHLADIDKLLAVLHKLVDRGATVVVIEHNLKIVKEADYIVDMGPEGGDGGGRIVAEGTPADLIKKYRKSHTARFLKSHLGL